MEEIAKWLTELVKSLVENKDAVDVQYASDDMGVLFTVKVAADEAGKIIGRQGSTAKAIRHLLHQIGMANKIRPSMKLDVPMLDKHQEQA